jgi:hypothetical protein
MPHCRRRGFDTSNPGQRDFLNDPRWRGRIAHTPSDTRGAPGKIKLDTGAPSSLIITPITSLAVSNSESLRGWDFA